MNLKFFERCGVTNIPFHSNVAQSSTLEAMSIILMSKPTTDSSFLYPPPPPSHTIETSVKKRSATVEQAGLVAGSLGLRTEHGFNAVVLGLLFLYPTITINRRVVGGGKSRG